MSKPAEMHVEKMGRTVQLTMTFVSDKEALRAFDAILKSLKNGELTLIMPVQKEHQLQ